MIKHVCSLTFLCDCFYNFRLSFAIEILFDYGTGCFLASDIRIPYITFMETEV